MKCNATWNAPIDLKTISYATYPNGGLKGGGGCRPVVRHSQCDFVRLCSRTQCANCVSNPPCLQMPGVQMHRPWLKYSISGVNHHSWHSHVYVWLLLGESQLAEAAAVNAQGHAIVYHTLMFFVHPTPRSRQPNDAPHLIFTYSKSKCCEASHVRQQNTRSYSVVWMTKKNTETSSLALHVTLGLFYIYICRFFVFALRQMPTITCEFVSYAAQIFDDQI